MRDSCIIKFDLINEWFQFQSGRNSMPQESSLLSSIFASPSSKRILNLKGSVFNNSEVSEEINDHELAYRKAEEAG